MHPSRLFSRRALSSWLKETSYCVRTLPARLVDPNGASHTHTAPLKHPPPACQQSQPQTPQRQQPTTLTPQATPASVPIPATIPQEGSQLSTPPTSQIGPAAAGPSSMQSTLPLPGANTNPAQPPQATHSRERKREREVEGGREGERRERGERESGRAGEKERERG